jgi:hypothetical protein
MRIAAFLLCFACTALHAAPSEISAEYKLTAEGIPIGSVNESYVRTGDSYSIESVTRSAGMLKVFFDDRIILTSTGRVVAAGLQPLAFAQHRASTDKGAVKATFDWEHGVMHSEANGNTNDVPLPRDTQDRISVMYQFMNLTQASALVTLPMSNGRKVELYTYRLVDQVRIDTPAGAFDTVHYERVTASPKESKAELWLAKDRFNFPVRIVFDDTKGLRLEQSLVALRSR